MNLINQIKSQISSLDTSPGAVQAGVIVFLVFLLLLVMARMSRSYISWYTSGWWMWTGLGILLAIVIEGFFVLNGTTIFTTVLGWQGAPKPIQYVIDSSRNKLSQTLGDKDEVTEENIVSDFNTLPLESQKNIRSSLCIPD